MSSDVQLGASTVVQILIGVLVAVLLEASRRLFKDRDRTIDRLDKLERNYVTHEELDKHFAQLREERAATEQRSDEKHLENKGTLRHIVDKLDSMQVAVIADRLKRIEQDVNDINAYTEDLKHEHIDPYEKEVGKLRIEVDTLKARVDVR